MKKYLLSTLLLLITSMPSILLAQAPFSWDNATVYFLLTDRFYNGDTNNDLPYGRTFDPVGGFLGGDLAGLTQKINDGYFDDIGVDAIWFTAPYEQIHGAVPGYWNGYPSDQHYAYHGYYALDFTEVDANMGDVADMQAFVDAAHAKGIRVIMDIVVNHVGYETLADVNEFGLGDLGNPWDPNNTPNVDDPDWCNWWTDDNGVSWIRKGDTSTDYCAEACGGGDLELCLAGLPDVRTELTTDVGLPKILQTKWDATKESQEISELNTFFNNTGLPRTPANHIIKWLTDWVRDYGIDGFRIDTYKHSEREIWGTLKDQAQIAFDDWKAANPAKVLDNNDFWMVGEWYGHGPGKNAEAVTIGKTDALINFNFQGQAGDPTALESVYSNYASIAADPEWNFLSYISSHDTDLFDRNDLIDAGTALLLAPGAVQIFYGDETQRMPSTTGSDQDTRSFMNWGSINNTVRNHWSKVGEFRQAHLSVGAGSHQQIGSSPYTFMRDYVDEINGNCDRIVAAIGTGTGSQTIDVSAAFEDGEQIRNAYTQEVATVTGGNITFNVGSEALILMEYVTPPPCLSISISPEICFDTDPVEVTITAVDGENPGTPPTIYYSFDGSATPNDLNDWTIYTAPFMLTQTETVYAFARNTNGDDSQVVSQEYNIGTQPTMTLYWNAGNAGCGVPYAYLWDVDGVEGTEVAPWPGVLMTETSIPGWYEYTLDACCTNVIFNCGSNQNQTDNLTACGTSCYDGGWGNCPNFGASVTISPSGGNHPSGSVNVTLSANEPNCDIYYTTDGSTPSNTNGTLYSGSFTVSGSPGNPTTVKSIAYCGGEISDIKEATYTFDETSNLTFWWDPQSSCGTPYIYYWNINGETNNPVGWPGVPMTDGDGDGWYEYTINDADCANVIFNCNGSPQSGDLENICENSCFQGSADGGGWATCPDFDATVSISPQGGNFPSGSVDVTLSAFGANCDIYYTTDGSTPSNTNGTLYTGSFTVSGSPGNPTTVKAIAYCGGEQSDIAEVTYTFDEAPSLTFHWDPQGGCGTPYIYFWDINGETSEPFGWPGVPMTDADGDGWYEYTLEDAECVNVIFSCNGSPQSTDHYSVCENSCYQGSAYQGEGERAGFVTCPIFEEECETHYTLTQAINTDTVYQAAETITSTSTIGASNTVGFEAGTSITLLPGFHAPAGATFSAVIEDCAPAALSSPAPEEQARITQEQASSVAADIADEALKMQVRPNPFRGQTQIVYNLAEATPVNLSVYNLSGQLVKEINRNAEAGYQEDYISDDNMQAGMYLLVLTTKQAVETRRIVVAR